MYIGVCLCVRDICVYVVFIPTQRGKRSLNDLRQQTVSEQEKSEEKIKKGPPICMN